MSRNEKGLLFNYNICELPKLLNLNANIYANFLVLNAKLSYLFRTYTIADLTLLLNVNTVLLWTIAFYTVFLGILAGLSSLLLTSYLLYLINT